MNGGRKGSESNIRSATHRQIYSTLPLLKSHLPLRHLLKEWGNRNRLAHNQCREYIQERHCVVPENIAPTSMFGLGIPVPTRPLGIRTAGAFNWHTR